MKVRVLIVSSLVAATWAVLPSGASAATPTCHGKTATIVGSGAGETIVGTNGNDVIVGNGGDDSIFGGAGNDTICGGEGNDFVNGAKGQDLIDGEKGKDTLLGGDDKDQFFGGPGIDTCTDVTPAEENADNEHDCDADFQVTASAVDQGSGSADLNGRLFNAGPSDEHGGLLRIELTATTGTFLAGFNVTTGQHASANCVTLDNTSTHLVVQCNVDMGSNTHVDVSGGMFFNGDVTFSLFTSPGRSVDPDWSNNTATDSVFSCSTNTSARQVSVQAC